MLFQRRFSARSAIGSSRRFHETGYSLHTLRQASRRSWRIGQRRPVEVKFFAYKDTMQEVCLRLMGRKLLVALAMEGKFASEGLQAIDGDDDMLTAMARELVENKGIGESAQNVWRSLGQQRPQSPSRGTEKLAMVLAPQGGTSIPGVSENTPVSGDGEEYPQTNSHRPDAEQLSLF